MNNDEVVNILREVGESGVDLNIVLESIIFSTICLSLSKAMDDDKKLRSIFNECGDLIDRSSLRENWYKLYGAVMIHDAWVNSLHETEYVYQSMFCKNVDKLIPDAKCVNRKNDRHNIPDAWVELNGEDLPVEVKRYCFDKKALCQLQRYIDFFHTNGGIAVAEKLTVELPDNIVFISLDQVREVAGKNEQ